MNQHLGKLAICIAAAAIVAGGCAGPAGTIASPQAALPANEGAAAFLDRVSSIPQVSENDAMRGVVLLMDGQDKTETFQDKVGFLQQKAIVPSGWDFDADRPITRGKLAYMIYKACQLSGGATLTLFGPSQWYCLKELQHQGFFSPGPVLAPVTGMEYVAVISRADSYLASGQIPEVLRARQ